MGKRSSFERSKNDLYDTPERGVLPLLPFLPGSTRFISPCYGNGYLVEHLQAHGHICVGAYDIEPRAGGVNKANACTREYYVGEADFFIENPPWTRALLHDIIANLSRQLPTWLLFDAAWSATLQAARLLPTCQKIVMVGRLKWIEGSAHQGKDDCCWYLFNHQHRAGPRVFGRGNPVENFVEEKSEPIYPHHSQLDPQDVQRENEVLFERVSRELSSQSSRLLQQRFRDSDSFEV